MPIRSLQKRLSGLLVVGCVVTTTAFAQEPMFQAESNALRACLDNYIQAEADKKNPNPQALLNRCNKEFKALKSQLLPDDEAQFNQLMRSDIAKQMKKIKKEKG